MATSRSRAATLRDRYSLSPSQRESFRELVWRLDGTSGLVAMYSVAFLVRILIAPHFGFYVDLNFFRTWARELHEVGPHRLYSTDHLVDYPPGYLYVLWLLGSISSTPGYLLLKLPAIIADLGLAWIAGTFSERLAPGSLKERIPVRAVVMAVVLFNPAVVALSAGWGQVDSVPVFFVLASLLLLFTGAQSLRRDLAAFLLFGIAFSIKPQTCLVFPVMAYALYRRYLHRKPRAELIDGALSIALVGALAASVWVVSGIAFGLGPVDLVRFYRHSAAVQPVTSANAFNFWGAIAFWRHDASGAGVLRIAGVPAIYVGMLLFAAATAWLLRQVHRAIERGLDQTRVLIVGAGVESLLGYTLLTRMHERYLFLTLACLAPVLFVRSFRVVYAALSGLFLLDLWYAYADFNIRVHAQTLRFEPWFDWVYGGFSTDPWQKKVLSFTVVATALVAAWRGLRWLERLEPAAAGAPVHRAPPTRPATAGEPGPGIVVAPLDDTADQESTRSVAGWIPLSLLSLSALFGLIVLKGETLYAQNQNDSSFHLLMVRWASGQLHHGRWPFDGWFPYFALGSSFFHHYQSLPHTLSAFVANATGAGDQSVYLWFLYLLLALWPIAVYLGARLLEWSNWTAGAAAAISPLLVSTPAYGYEHGSYTWQGYGIYGQLWAMWLLPIAWGLTWRAVAHGRQYAAAAVALALTIACHFITGYLAVLTVGVWVIVLGKAGFVRRVCRAAVATVGGLLVASWVLVPLISDIKWTARTEYYKGTIFNDSFGAEKILAWLFTGQIFDGQRGFPVITVLFFLGIVLCILRARADIRARALLGVFTVSLFLFFGRRTWHRLIDLLPGMGDVQIHRFIMGVHLAGILIAGVGLGWLLRTAYSETMRRVPGPYASAAGAAAIALCVAALAPAWIERLHYDNRGTALIRSQQGYDATAGRDVDRLIDIVEKRHDGRVYAGLRANWGPQYRVGSVPVQAWLADRGIDAIGLVFRTITSLSTDIEVAFDENNPAQYQMLNIRYVLVPSDRKPTVPAKLLASAGSNRLYEVHTSGYFQLVDRAASVSANRTNIEPATRDFRNSQLALQGIYPSVAFPGEPALPPTYEGTRPPPGPAGTVLAQSNALQDGVFDATVTARRRAVVLLKATYDPRWTVTVDGQHAKPEMMAPSLVGVEVPPGRHVVRFRYAPYSHYPILLAIGALTLLGLVLVPRRQALMRTARAWARAA
jgi:Gpi18-like mannosyltransferase